MYLNLQILFTEVMFEAHFLQHGTTNIQNKIISVDWYTLISKIKNFKWMNRLLYALQGGVQGFCESVLEIFCEL